MAPNANNTDDIAVIDEDLISNSLAQSEIDNNTSHSNSNNSNNNSNSTNIKAATSTSLSTTLSSKVSTATLLRLSFKNVKKIANLAGFQNLTTLCLDNNVIDKIDNISHLVNLKWLDLSFNSIRKIGGLEALTQLMDLSLFNNKIGFIGGLDSCVKLQCLSLGNNSITSLDGSGSKNQNAQPETTITETTGNEVGLCHYLRKFKKLHLVNLEGNPVCKEEEYKMMMLAYLPNIKYLDYALIHPSEIASAVERYQDELQEEEETEVIVNEKNKRNEDAIKLTLILDDANLSVVQTIFEEFFKDDAEYLKLKFLPGISDLVAVLRDAVDNVSETFKISGLKLDDSKKIEVGKFEEVVKSLRKADSVTSVNMIEDFSREKKRIFRQIEAGAASGSSAQVLIDNLDVLYENLMDIELQQCQSFDDYLSEFESTYAELKAQMLELQVAYFRGVEEAEENYFAAVTALAGDLLEKSGKDELAFELSEDAAALLIDRDILINSITGSHDSHVSKLFKSEEDTRLRELTRFTSTVQKYMDTAGDRNRRGVKEMFEFKESNKREVAFVMEEEMIDDEEYDEL